MNQHAEDQSFQVGDNVVYPTHGVGQITAEEVQVVAGIEMNVYVISFAKEKMVLRVPKSKASRSGLRHLSTKNGLEEMATTLKGRPRITKGMWSKRAQEYERKINSGNIVSIAEVVRDLHPSVVDPDRSYSEKIIYELALSRLVVEYSLAAGMDKSAAQDKIVTILDYMKNE